MNRETVAKPHLRQRGEWWLAYFNRAHANSKTIPVCHRKSLDDAVAQYYEYMGNPKNYPREWNKK